MAVVGEDNLGPSATRRRIQPLRRNVAHRLTTPIADRIARVPARVNTKLLVALAGLVALLILLGVFALRLLSDSNGRVEHLGDLQLRATAYREIQTSADEVRVLFGVRAGGGDLNIYVGGNGQAPTGDALAPINQAIVPTLSRIGPATDLASLGFDPPADERTKIEQIHSDFVSLSDSLGQIIALDQSGQSADALRLQSQTAEPLARDMQDLAAGLVGSIQKQTTALVTENGISFDDSQKLFILVFVLMALLALLIGYVLSLSFVRPIRAMESRLSSIAAGDFSGHVSVVNRDELGSLATNLNRMNDELGRLYKDLETANRDLDAASRHKSEFLANMSHELRTPLNAIIGFSDVLREGMVGEVNAKQTEYLDDIGSSGRHLLSLINDILDLSKVEAGQMELQATWLSLRDAVDTSLTMIRERAANHDIELTVDYQLADAQIEADERKVKQVLFNLLSNAVKFTPPGGQIQVIVRSGGEDAVISVRDTGVGIAPEEQERIFEAFQQVRGSGSAPQEGTGLGLGLARRMVELHGGRIWVESSLGKGSTFTFVIPVRQTTQTTDATS